MHVLVISQYYPPETGGPQNRLLSLVRGIQAEGHSVTVITEKPNYPTGVIWDDYRDGGLIVDRTYEEVPVRYCWIWEDHHKTTITRIRFFLSFVVLSIVASFRVKNVDAVVASSPPLFVGLSGWIVSRLKRARFVFDVRDLWPDVAIAMGELRPGRAARIGKWLERFIYRKAHGITAVTNSFCEAIRGDAPAATPIRRVTNGTVPEDFVVSESRESLRRELSIGSGFVAVYAGNVGLAQGIEHFVDAAILMRDRGIDARMVVVGDGAAKESIVKRAATYEDLNIEFRSRVGLKEAARYMAAADALLVPLSATPIFTKFIPSKLFDSMAAGKPLLLSVDGESRTILEDAGAGLWYPAEDPEGLVDAIAQLQRAPAAAEAMGSRGRNYVAQHFSRESQARILVRFLEELTGQSRPDAVQTSQHQLKEAS